MMMLSKCWKESGAEKESEYNTITHTYTELAKNFSTFIRRKMGRPSNSCYTTIKCL